MVFNWFNRFKKEEKKPEPEPKPPEAPIEVSPPLEEAEPYYMRLAKEIQRKEEQKPPTTTESLKAEVPSDQLPQVETNEEMFDWQKILYGTKASPTPEEAPTSELLQESRIEIPEPLIELPPTPIVEFPIQAEVVVEEVTIAPVVESPTLPAVQISTPFFEKPLEPVIADIPAPIAIPDTTSEVPVPFLEKPIETVAIPDVSGPIVEPPVLEPTISTPSPQESLPEPEPAPQTAQPTIPFWKRILGQRSPDSETSPTPENPAPTPLLEASVPIDPPVVLPLVDEVLDPFVAPTPEPQADAVPFWKRILGQRPAISPTAEPALIPREKPTTEPLPGQFDTGFLWSAEVLAAQGRRPEDVTLEEISWLQKLRTGLGRTRRGLVNNIKAIVGRGPLGPQELEELEELLLQADVGIGVSEKILESLQAKVRQEALPPDQAMTFLKDQLRKQVELKGDDPAKFAPLRDQLNIWLVVGVNGVGKTTTIGKLASLASRSGYRTMIAAGDTFRAGAVSQVQIWAERSKVPVISNPSPNADPASVVFDAIGAARARNIELLIVDTAGRLQNKKNLMDELAKIRRIIDKQGVGAQVESLLVLDSTTGQNGLQQAKVFTEVASLTGVVLTKLDGSAKGGIALAIVDELHLPIRFIGVGEKVDDLRPFNSYEFIEALLSDIED